MTERETLFTVTLKDCRVDTFRAGGKGGQNQNKRDSGVRVVHAPSGAVGESREERSQLQNKKKAFQRMAESKLFVRWAMQKGADIIAERANRLTVEQAVKEALKPENLKIEVCRDGKWEEDNGDGNQD